jgi:hypothetical protein
LCKIQFIVLYQLQFICMISLLMILCIFMITFNIVYTYTRFCSFY